VIAAEKIVVRAGKHVLLDGVDLAIAGGELVALLGPNGAGKSTLLRALSGDLAPASGRVLACGMPLGAWAPDALAQIRGVLEQDVHVAFPFTAYEIVLMGRTPHAPHGEGARDHEIARAALDEVNAAHLRDRSYLTLSGGERQRVQLARVLAQVWRDEASTAPRILLLDEPTTSLDPVHQHAMLALARKLADGGAAVLVILHDLNLAALYATRVALAKAGRIIVDTATKEALTPEHIRETFGIEAVVRDNPIDGVPMIAIGRQRARVF
jgi:iron complex transport system ATP-binding protein